MRLDKLEWTRKMLGEILVANYGKSLPKTKRIAGNINVYGSGGIVGSHNEYLVKGPGIIIGRKGTVGSINYVKDNYYPIDTVYYIQEGLDYDLKFLFYKLKTIGLDKMNTHSAVPGLNREHMYSKEVLMPKINEQKAIAKILSDLDEKIEVNNKINKNLEEMAQAIFKQWFVDFEFPNEEGKPYKSSGGEMVESELGIIPKGWNCGLIENIATVIGGATPSKKNESYFINGNIPWVTPKDLSDNKNIYISKGTTNITKEAYKSTSVKFMPRNTVLFSSRAPIGYIAIAKNELTTNQGFKSLVPNNDIGMTANYIYCFLKSIKKSIENRASGSTFKEISGSELKKIEVIIPAKGILQKYYKFTENIFWEIENIESENERLEKLRDTLLPKLMSGEIRVPLEYSEN
ncbi:restriction endonuclease subunit S [Clostridium perfringens]|uniref:restriction endonuclease subunit S n=1 Tax=Clostridium perfringens TaxID=1502 RepID=UPI001C870667|nr:restriction endonuclease subunit S [Clostridium perfringens]MDK0786906.1 restriction endonuclease subunit S [Clostridium perfringens]